MMNHYHNHKLNAAGGLPFFSGELFFGSEL